MTEQEVKRLFRRIRLTFYGSAFFCGLIIGISTAPLTASLSPGTRFLILIAIVVVFEQSVSSLARHSAKSKVSTESPGELVPMEKPHRRREWVGVAWRYREQWLSPPALQKSVS